MRFKILGKSRSTGENLEFSPLEATDHLDAMRRADLMGIQITKVIPLDDESTATIASSKSGSKESRASKSDTDQTKSEANQVNSAESLTEKAQIQSENLLYLGTLCTICVIGIGLTTIWCMYCISFEFNLIGDKKEIDERDSLAMRDNWIALLVLNTCAGIAYLFWSYRAYLNSKKIMKIKGGGSLAIWSWLLPVANLILPCLVLMRIMKGSYTRHSLTNKSLITLGWWVPFLALLLLQLAHINTNIQLDEIISITATSVVLLPLSGIFLIYCIMRATKLQNKQLATNQSLLRMKSVQYHNELKSHGFDHLPSQQKDLIKKIADIHKRKWRAFYIIFFVLFALLSFGLLDPQHPLRFDVSPSKVRGATGTIGALVAWFGIPALIASPSLFSMKQRRYRKRLKELIENR